MPGISGYNDKRQTHLYLELLNSQDKELIYLITVQASLINVKLNPKVKVRLIRVNNTCMATTMELEWSSGYYRLYDHVKYHFPTAVPVPWTKRLKVTRMVREACHMRLLTQDDVFYGLAELYQTPFKKTNEAGIQTDCNLQNMDYYIEDQIIE